MFEIALYLNCDSQFDVRSRGALKEVVRLVFWKIVKRPQIRLPLSWQRPLSYRNQSIGLQNKLMDWCQYDRDLRHETFESKNLWKLFLEVISQWSVHHIVFLNVTLKGTVMQIEKALIMIAYVFQKYPENFNYL